MCVVYTVLVSQAHELINFDDTVDPLPYWQIDSRQGSDNN